MRFPAFAVNEARDCHKPDHGSDQEGEQEVGRDGEGEGGFAGFVGGVTGKYNLEGIIPGQVFGGESKRLRRGAECTQEHPLGVLIPVNLERSGDVHPTPQLEGFPLPLVGRLIGDGEGTGVPLNSEELRTCLDEGMVDVQHASEGMTSPGQCHVLDGDLEGSSPINVDLAEESAHITVNPNIGMVQEVDGNVIGSAIYGEVK